MNRATSKANERERSWIQFTLSRIYQQILRRGFHGQGTLTITVQDGTIQHTKDAVEEVHHRPQ